MIDGLLHGQSLADVGAHEAFNEFAGLKAQGLISSAFSDELSTLDRLV